MKTVVTSFVNGEPWEVEHGMMVPIECCDCSLIHWVRFKVDDNKVTTYWYRDDYETAQVRKNK